MIDGVPALKKNTEFTECNECFLLMSVCLNISLKR